METLKDLPPKIIGFEGCDCSGKSTLIKQVQDMLDAAGVPSVVLHKIHEGPVKDLLLNDSSLSSKQQLLLLGSCFLETEEAIKKTLADGKWVLLDRTQITRTVFQGMVDQLYFESGMLSSIIGPEKDVDYLCFVDQPEELILERLAVKENRDTFENKGEAYHRQVYAKYQLAVTAFDDLNTLRRDARRDAGLPVTGIPYTIRISGTHTPMMAEELLDTITSIESSNNLS